MKECIHMSIGGDCMLKYDELPKCYECEGFERCENYEEEIE